MQDKGSLQPDISREDVIGDLNIRQTRGQTRVDAQRNRMAVIRGAERMFVDQGFDATLADIAAAANVGRTTLMRHFPTRTDLAFAIFERAVTELKALAARQTGQPTDFEDLLEAKLQSHVRNGALAEAVRREQGAHPAFLAQMTEMANLFVTAAHLAAAAGRMAELTFETAMMLQHAISGAMLTGGSPNERAARARRLKRLLLDGLIKG